MSLVVMRQDALHKMIETLARGFRAAVIDDPMV